MTDATLQDFRERYPEFCEIANDLAERILEEAVAEVSDMWPERLRVAAQLALMAHTISVEGGSSRNAAGATLGPMTSRKEGDVSVTFAAGSDQSNQKGMDLLGTTYGRHYSRLRKKAFAGKGILAV